MFISFSSILTFFILIIISIIPAAQLCYIKILLNKLDIEANETLNCFNDLNVINITVWLIIYILTGIFYALSIITLSIDIFFNFIPIESFLAQYKVYIIVAFLFTFILFYSIPLLKYLRLDKAYNVINFSIRKLFMYVDNFSNNSIYILGHILGLFLLMGYIYVLNWFNAAYLGVNFIFFNVSSIFIYQKYINNLLSSRFFIYFDKHKFNINNLDFIVELHENSNYMYLVIITMISYMENIFDSKMLYAITIVFLFDTYYQNHRKICDQVLSKI